MLHAVAAMCPDAQLAWEAPMACGYGACYGCVVEIDGALKRLCLEGPVLDASRIGKWLSVTKSEGVPA
jgi:ferredoxin